ncbi:CheB methylesterase domain-containing protein [Campylobacter cuniculorum]|uniref:CheB methylesterase domain-containing protein n=1 Tax=Campylobacter cuniculorum TaxID=374106 RepID=UPI0023F0CF4C|nr:CheB methylesterase domain-containing protein [Campylobacter cuniculorum]
MKLVLIGSSTGGPNQLRFLLEDINVKNTCIIVAQHMTENFIPSFIKQFDKHSLSKVSVLNDKEYLSNKIYICCKNTILSKYNSPLKKHSDIVSHWQDIQTPYSPSVDLLFDSAITFAKTNEMLAILLTGMGDDGAKSLLKLHQAGVKCLAENEEDSVVYGMPKRAKQLNPDLKQMSLESIKKEILQFIK